MKISLHRSLCERVGHPHHSTARYASGLGILIACWMQATLHAQPKFDALAKSASQKYESKDFSGAIEDYTKLIEMYPGMAGQYYNRGLAEQDAENFAGAVADYSKAIELKPDEPNYYNNRGNTRDKLRDFAGAIEDFDKAIKLNPKLPRPYFNRGNAKRRLKNFKGAIIDYDKCIELDPKHSTAYEGRGLAQYDSVQWRPALDSFRKLRELNPTQDDYSRFRIWLLRSHLGETEAATKELATHVNSLQGALARDWPAQIGKYLIGEISEAGFLRLAETSAKTQEDKNTRICEASFYAGMKRLLAGEKSEAARLFQKCLDTKEETYDEYGSAETEISFLKKP